MLRLLRRVVLSPHVAGLLIIIACAAVVQYLIDAGLVPELIVARPTDAIAAILPLEKESNLFGNFLLTFGMTAAATVIALAIGIPLGWLLYRKEILGEAYEGWLAAAFASPIVLLYPLFLVIFGRTYLTLIIMGCIPGAIPIIIQTRQGLLAVSRTLLNVGRSFNLTPRQMFWKIMLPAAVPSMFNGIRIGVMYALVTVVAIEYLTDFGGLGRIVSDMYMLFEIPKTYASILAVIVASVLLYGIFGRIEKWLRPV
jgi:ABC-type nitrate/sulfonate/bicarbonate transport system permease component